MKKLLGILGTITITGSGMSGIVGNAPAPAKNGINYLQTNNSEKLNRNKRALENDKIDVSWDDYFLGFRPNLWEEIKINYNYYSNLSNFQEWFKNRMNAGVWQDHRIDGVDWVLKGIAKNIWNNWSIYNNLWENSSKRGNIWIKIARDNNFSYRECRIYHSGEYTNWRLDNELNNNWNRDFNNKADLGIIDNAENETIWNAVKKQNPNLDISELNISNKTNFSFLNKEFSVKITVKANSKKYPTTKNVKISFISKEFLINDLPKIIGQENLIENWNSNFNEWKNEINRQKTQDIPKYGDDERGKALKRTWKGNHLNELKNKLLSLNHILETIDNKLKINELYKTVKGLQKDINDLKQQISELNQEIDKIKTNLEGNKDLETCTKVGGLISATTGWIPIVGTLLSTVSGTVSAICDIANT
ncbi:hypothetical protein [Spiroplasma endosymbiont of Tipula paludosa]|uniref:hypothetical protein n=1 Tax=Spiroplasma endosymbiont of Tipula paludosa TaxID=3066295 RepID=UPI0035C88005